MRTHQRSRLQAPQKVVFIHHLDVLAVVLLKAPLSDASLNEV